MSDVRTFVMAAVANGLKLTESVRRQGVVMAGMIIAVLLGLALSVWATIYLAYEVGANNSNSWFFLNGPQYMINYAVLYLRNPMGPDGEGLALMGLGGGLMSGLYWMRARMFAFAIHPLGLAVSQMMLTRHMWFSLFLAWLIKMLLIRFGGPSILKASRGRGNILKRLLIHVAGFNLSLIMRQLLGVGTPRGFAALLKALRTSFEALLSALGIEMLRLRALILLQP